jgi:hypothetical protein
LAGSARSLWLSAFSKGITTYTNKIHIMIAEPLSITAAPAFGARAHKEPQHFATEVFYTAQCDVGMGVFANRDIAPWEVILEFGGPIIDFAETKRRGARECMAVQIGKNRYFDTWAPAVYVNHSCAPNAGIICDQYLVALRPIRKGQEIRFDYSTTMEEQSYTMECLCGEPNCRHVIADFSSLPSETRHRYLSLGIVMSFIAHQHNSSAHIFATRARAPRQAQARYDFSAPVAV